MRNKKHIYPKPITNFQWIKKNDTPSTSSIYDRLSIWITGVGRTMVSLLEFGKCWNGKQKWKIRFTFPKETFYVLSLSSGIIK